MRVIKCTRAKKWIFVNRNRCDNIYTRKCRIPHETLSIGIYEKKEGKNTNKNKMEKRQARKKEKEKEKAQRPSGHNISV